jgi:hypothetical protein
VNREVQELEGNFWAPLSKTVQSCLYTSLALRMLALLYRVLLLGPNGSCSCDVPGDCRPLGAIRPTKKNYMLLNQLLSLTNTQPLSADSWNSGGPNESLKLL